MGALKKLVDERQSVVQQPYPVPQTEVNTARDVGPHTPRQQSQQAENAKGDNVIYATFEEVKTKEFAAKLADSPKAMGAMEAAMEGVKAFRDAFFPGLDWDKFKSEVWNEMKEMGKQGSHELAAALFTGNAFVMYPRAEKELEGRDDFER